MGMSSVSPRRFESSRWWRWDRQIKPHRAKCGISRFKFHGFDATVNPLSRSQCLKDRCKAQLLKSVLIDLSFKAPIVMI